MSGKTDRRQLINDLGKVLPLLARDAAAAAVAAGTLAGPEGIALGERLRDFALDDLRDLERVAARVTALGGSASLTTEKLQPPADWLGTVKWLAKAERETLEALVQAIPADADDAEGEASEHLLEHIVARKRDALELVERALRRPSS